MSILDFFGGSQDYLRPDGTFDPAAYRNAKIADSIGSLSQGLIAYGMGQPGQAAQAFGQMGKQDRLEPFKLQQLAAQAKKAQAEQARLEWWQGMFGPGGASGEQASPLLAGVTGQQRLALSMMPPTEGAKALMEMQDPTKRFKVEGGNIIDFQREGGPGVVGQARPLAAAPFGMVEGPGGQVANAPGYAEARAAQTEADELAKARVGLAYAGPLAGAKAGAELPYQMQRDNNQAAAGAQGRITSALGSPMTVSPGASVVVPGATQSITPTGGDSQARANNVGNIRQGTDGFRTYATAEEGIAAAVKNVQSYPARFNGGKPMTLLQISERWAPKGDGNDPAQHARNVSMFGGLPVDQPLDLNDPVIAAKFARGIHGAEKIGGGKLADDLYQRGVQMAMSGQAPPAAQAAPASPGVLYQAPPAPPSADAAFKNANTLRDEVNTLTKDYRTVADAYGKIKSAASANNGAGDMSMLYSYVKLLDPGSVVRESEFATAAASGSFGERMQGLVGRVLSGERLPDSLRSDFLAEADKIHTIQRQGYDRVASQYGEIADRSGIKRGDVLVDYGAPSAPVATPSAAASPRPRATNPQGQAVEFDGKAWVPVK